MSNVLIKFLDGICKSRLPISMDEIKRIGANYCVPEKFVLKLIQSCSYVMFNYDGDKEYVISPTALFHWTIHCSYSICRNDNPYLTKQEIAQKICLLTQSAICDVQLDEILKCLIENNVVVTVGGMYMFPITLCFRSMSSAIAVRTYNDLNLHIISYSSLVTRSRLFERAGIKFLDSLPDNYHTILRNRYTTKSLKLTLSSVGDILGVTRERVRQLEAKLKDLVFKFLSEEEWNSKLIIDSFINRTNSRINYDYPVVNVLCLVQAKSFTSIAFSVSEFTFHFMGLSTRKFLADVKLTKEEFCEDLDVVFAELCIKIEMSPADFRMLWPYIVRDSIAKLSVTEKLYITMKKLGRPAHYTKIAECYNGDFPGENRSVRLVHAALTRQEHGVMWVGMKGIYALEEWGFERVNETLFELVAQIVASEFEKTGRAVTLDFIHSCILERRKVANFSSTAIAAGMNEKVVSLGNQQFVPQTIENGNSEPDLLMLDNVLSELSIE